MSISGSTSQAFDDIWDGDSVHARTQAEQLVITSKERSVITLDEYARLVIDYAESQQERARRKAIAKRICILRDAWGPILKAKIESVTTPIMQIRLMGRNRDNLDLSRNPAKRIWRDLGVMYKLPPRRKTADGKNGELYKKIIKRTKFNLFWKTVELLLNACNEVLVWPDVAVCNGRKIPRHRYATGDRCVIVTSDEDPEIIECVLIIDEFTDLGGNEHKHYILWTDKWHAVYSAEQKRVNGRTEQSLARVDDNGEDAPNPFGAIPHHLLRRVSWQDSIWDITSGEDLIDATLNGGVARSFSRYHQKMSGFKSVMAVGSIDNDAKQLFDVGTISKVQGDDVRVTQLDWQLDIVSQQQVIDRDEESAAASRGVNPELYKHTANYQSVTGAQLAERPLHELRAEMIPILDEAEAAYYRSACTVWAALGIDNVPDPDAEFEIEFAPISYPAEPDKQLDVDEREIALGINNHVTLLQRRLPELSDAEAERRIEKNWKIISKIQGIKTKHNVPNKPSNESFSAEENGRLGPMIRDNMDDQPGSLPGKTMNSDKDRT